MGVPNELNAAYGGGSGSGPPLPVPLRSNAGRYLNHSLIGAGPYLDLKPIVPSQFTPHVLKNSLKSVDGDGIAEAASLSLATPNTSKAFVPSSTALSLCEAATHTSSLLSLGVSSHPDDSLRSLDLFLDFHPDELDVKNSEKNKSDLEDYHDQPHSPPLFIGSRPNTSNPLLRPLSLEISSKEKSPESYGVTRSRSKSPAKAPVRSQTRLRHLSRLQGFTSEENRTSRWTLHPRPATGPRTRALSPSPLGSRGASSVSSLFPRLLGSLVYFPHLMEGASAQRPLLPPPQYPCPVHDRDKARPLRQEELLPSGRLGRRAENSRGSWSLLPNVAEEGSSSGADGGAPEDVSSTLKSLLREVSPKRTPSSVSSESPKSGSPKRTSPVRHSMSDSPSDAMLERDHWDSCLSKTSNDSWGEGVGLRFQELENEARREELLRKSLRHWKEKSHLCNGSDSNCQKPPPSVLPSREGRVKMSHSRSEGNYSSRKTKSSQVFERKVRRLEKLLQGTYYEGAVIRPDPELSYFTSSEETLDSSLDSDSSLSEVSSSQRAKKPSGECGREWEMPALTQPSPLDMRWSRGTAIEDSGDVVADAMRCSSFAGDEGATRTNSHVSASRDSERSWDLREVEEAKEVLQRLHDWLSTNMQQQHPSNEGQDSEESSIASESWNSSLLREAAHLVYKEQPLTSSCNRMSAAAKASSAEVAPPALLPPSLLLHPGATRTPERPRTPGGDVGAPLSEREEVRPCTPSGDEARPFPGPLRIRAPEIRSRLASAKDSVWPTSAIPKREPEAEKMVEDRIALTKARMAALNTYSEEDDDDEDREFKEEWDEGVSDGWDPSASLWAGVERARQVASTAAGHLKSGFCVMKNFFTKCFYPSRLMEARREARRNKPRSLGGGSSGPASRRSSPRASSDSEGAQGELEAAGADGGAADASDAGGGGGGGSVAGGGQPPGQPSSPICRICHSGPHSVPGLGPLLAPCRCRGTVALIHKSCLEHWLTEVGSDHCELCGFRFRTTYEPHMSLAYALLLWIKNGLDFRQMIQDLVWLSVMTPMAGMAAYTALNTARLLAVGPRAAQASAPWLLAGLFVSCSITLVAYYGWVLGAVHHYTNVWRNWWRRNFSVRVLFDTDESLPRVELAAGGGGGTAGVDGGGCCGGGGGTGVDDGGCCGGGGGVVTGVNVALDPQEPPASEFLLKVYANAE